MRIAIPSNDKTNVFQRTGRADAFLVVEVDQAGFSEIGYRKNPHTYDEHSHHQSDHHGHSHDELVEAISDCSFAVVNHIGKYLLADLTNAGIGVFKTTKNTVKDAIADFIANGQMGNGE